MSHEEAAQRKRSNGSLPDVGAWLRLLPRGPRSIRGSGLDDTSNVEGQKVSAVRKRRAGVSDFSDPSMKIPAPRIQLPEPLAHIPQTVRDEVPHAVPPSLNPNRVGQSSMEIPGQFCVEINTHRLPARAALGLARHKASFCGDRSVRKPGGAIVLGPMNGCTSSGQPIGHGPLARTLSTDLEPCTYRWDASWQACQRHGSNRWNRLRSERRPDGAEDTRIDMQSGSIAHARRTVR